MSERAYQEPYAGRRLPDEPNVLAAALRGFLGQTEPGSVLEPTTALNKDVNERVGLISMLSDLLPGKALFGAAAKSALRSGALVDALRTAAPVQSKTTSLSDLLRQSATQPVTAKYDFKVDPKNRTVYVHKKTEPAPDTNNAVAWLGVEPVPGGKHWATDVMVDARHQREGIATEMYKQLTNAGIPITKSNDVTAAGEKMWESWHRRGLAKDNEFFGQ